MCPTFLETWWLIKIEADTSVKGNGLKEMAFQMRSHISAAVDHLLMHISFNETRHEVLGESHKAVD